jgi:hypothetical protein
VGTDEGVATVRDASNETRIHEKQEAAARAAYEAPALTVIGPMSQFTFGSKQSGNDGGPGRKN